MTTSCKNYLLSSPDFSNAKSPEKKGKEFERKQKA